MKLLLIDPITFNQWHCNLNRTIIDAILQFSFTNKIELLLEGEQLKQDLMSVYKSNPKVNTIPLNSSSDTASKAHIINRHFKTFRKLQRSLKKSRFNGLYILASDNLFWPLFIFFIKMSNPHLKIFIVLHNNTQTILSSPFKRWLWSKVLSKNVTGILLASSLCDKLKKVLPKSNLITIEHPVYKHLILNNSPKENTIKNDFLILGRHSSSIGDNQFTKSIVSAIQKHKQPVSILIGNNCQQLPPLSNARITRYKFPVKISEYWEMIYNSKFIIIPEESGHRLTASGVHLDAITALKPVIAPKKGVFKDNITGCNTQFLYDIDTVEHVIENALNIDSSVYKKAVDEIKSVRDTLTLEKTSEKLENAYLAG